VLGAAGSAPPPPLSHQHPTSIVLGFLALLAATTTALNLCNTHTVHLQKIRVDALNYLLPNLSLKTQFYRNHLILQIKQKEN
jgi:hypothetical protein